MSAPVPDVRQDGSATGSAGATSLSWTHALSAGLTNSALVGLASLAGSGPPTLTSLQWDATGTPVSMTAEAAVSDGFTGRACVSYLLAPASGTKTVKVTPSASCQIIGGSASYSNVDQTTPWNAASPQSATGTGGTTSLTVTSGTNELAIGMICDDEQTTQDTLVITAGQTKIHNDTISGTGQSASAGSDQAGSATVTHSYTGVGSASDWVIVAASLRGVTVTAVQAPLLLPLRQGAPNGPRGMIAMAMRLFRTPSPDVPVVVSSILQRRTLHDFGTHAGGRSVRGDS